MERQRSEQGRRGTGVVMEESERVAIKMQQFSIKMQSERVAISLEAQHASNTAALSGDSPPSLPHVLLTPTSTNR